VSPEILPDDIAALRALVLAEREGERAEKARLIEERDQLAVRTTDCASCSGCSSAGVPKTRPTRSTWLETSKNLAVLVVL
jgi:hypothetical protein